MQLWPDSVWCTCHMCTVLSGSLALTVSCDLSNEGLQSAEVMHRGRTSCLTDHLPDPVRLLIHIRQLLVTPAQTRLAVEITSAVCQPAQMMPILLAMSRAS